MAKDVETLRSQVLDLLDDQAIIRFAQDLVRTNSVNPNLEEGATEQAVADLVALAGRGAGLQVHEEAVAPGRPNVLATYPGRSGRLGLLFLCHTDTVPFLGMEKPLSGEIVDGQLWGRGSVDMKGGLAAAAQAVMALGRSGIPLEKSVAIAAVADEESEHRGAFVLARSGLKADACIVPEASNNTLLLGCKGTAPIYIHWAGRLAHGSSPWLGVNAIDKAANFLSALAQLEPKEVEVPELRIKIRGTVNVGMIKGGTAYNNVADHCSIYIDRRMVPGETQQSCLEELRQILERLATHDPDFKAALEIARPDWRWKEIKERGLNPAYTPLGSAVGKAVQRAHRATYGQDVGLGYSNGYMDMDFMVNDLGIPTVNYGPGDDGLCHHNQECLLVEQLLAATRVYVRAAIDLAA